jgi:hypothetical protein
LTSTLLTNEFKNATDLKDAVFSDNIIELNCNIENDEQDAGLAFKYYDQINHAHRWRGMYVDSATKEFYLFKNYGIRPHPSIDHTLIEMADLTCNKLNTTYLNNLTIPFKSGVIATVDDNALPFSWFRIGRSNIKSKMTPLNGINTPVVFDTSWNYMIDQKGVNVYEIQNNNSDIKILTTGSYKVNVNITWRRFYQIVINEIPHEGDATILNNLAFRLLKNGLYDIYIHECDIVEIIPKLDEWYSGYIHFETIIDISANDTISVCINQSLIDGLASQITLFPLMTIERVI